MSKSYSVQGAGLGLRKSFLKQLDNISHKIDFLEIAPENWVEVGGRDAYIFRSLTEQFPFVCHGLSLNLGGMAPLDEEFLKCIKKFIDTHNIKIYSEHLSYCADEGYLYDLLPIPFTEEAVKYVSSRIKRAQEIIGKRIAIENVSYYAAPGQELKEIEFIKSILEEADCELLVDINNIYVNSINHNYEAESFLKALPKERIAYSHIAGHYNEDIDLLVDTHGADVIDPVWSLLEKAYQYFGVFPTLLERDFNIPKFEKLLKEVEMIKSKQILNGW
mgnify:FL=1